MNLSNLKPAAGSTKSDKRIGRGQGSGRGGTSTRGHKGAQSRSGYSSKLEGGQMPLQRRLPKGHDKSLKRVEYKGINLLVLEELAQKSSLKSISVDTLIEAGLVNKNARVKILGNGTLSVALEVTAHAFSKSAAAAIEAQGGKVTKPSKIYSRSRSCARGSSLRSP